MSATGAITARTISRVHAAALLRDARWQVRRQAERLPADLTAVDWALLALPDSIAARRLTIQSLLLVGDERHVDALLARSLLRWPGQPSLLLLQAQRLLDLGNAEAAHRIIASVLPQRPHHVSTLLCAGHIASALGRNSDAAGFLETAHQRSRGPRRDLVGRELVHALLAAGRPEEAETVVHSLQSSCDDLVALVREGQGRICEAVESMQRAASRADEPTARQAILCRLATALERAGDHARLHEVLTELDRGSNTTRIRAAQGWLALGDFDRSDEAASDLVDDPTCGRSAVALLLARAAGSGRMTAAAGLMQRFSAAADESDRVSLAETWVCAIQGRIIAEQCSATAGADPSAGLLRPLLQHALTTFDELASPSTECGDSAERFHEQHRRRCLELLEQVSG